jgi:hypothetical protein
MGLWCIASLTPSHVGVYLITGRCPLSLAVGLAVVHERSQVWCLFYGRGLHSIYSSWDGALDERSHVGVCFMTGGRTLSIPIGLAVL